jgi:hypothetical protein
MYSLPLFIVRARTTTRFASAALRTQENTLGFVEIFHLESQRQIDNPFTTTALLDCVSYRNHGCRKVSILYSANDMMARGRS